MDLLITKTFFSCKKGKEGLRGPKGATGAQGYPGLPGMPGEPGIRGKTGICLLNDYFNKSYLIQIKFAV